MTDKPTEDKTREPAEPDAYRRTEDEPEVEGHRMLGADMARGQREEVEGRRRQA